MSFSLYIIFLALIFTRPVETFLPELSTYRPMMILGAVTLLAATFGGEGGQRRVLGKAHLLLMAGLLLALFLSQASRGWLSGGMQALTDFLPAATIYFLTLLNVTSQKRLRITCATIALSTTLLAIASVSSLFTGFMAERLVLQQNSEGVADAVLANVGDAASSSLKFLRIRSLGFFSDPNDFAQALIVAITLFGALWVRGNWIGNILFRLLPATILFYATYLTYSRGALLSLVAVAFMGFKTKLGKGLSTVLISLFVVLAVAVGFGGGRTFSASDESAGGRIDAWSQGLAMLKNHPLFGVGYGSFTDHHNYVAHNQFVHCFAELGLFGYFFWIALMVQAWFELGWGINNSANGSNEKYMASALRITFIGFLVCAFFLSRSYVPSLYLLLALMTCSGAIASRANPKPALLWPKHAIQVRTTVIGMTLSIAVAYCVVVVNNMIH